MRALTELKKECMKRLISRDSQVNCKICDEMRPKRLLIHHVSYDRNSITYNQFENSDDGRLKYYSTLLDEIKRRGPENFVTLCINCHNKLEKLVSKSLHEKIIYKIEDEKFYRIYSITVACRISKKSVTQIMNEFNKTSLTCVYCNEEWLDDVDISKGYEIQYSICNTCANQLNLNPLLEKKSFHLVDNESCVTPDGLKKIAELTNRDKERYRGSPCLWCGKKSIVRIRRYNQDYSKPDIIAGCEDHLVDFKILCETHRSENYGKIFLLNSDGTFAKQNGNEPVVITE